MHLRKIPSLICARCSRCLILCFWLAFNEKLYAFKVGKSKLQLKYTATTKWRKKKEYRLNRIESSRRFPQIYNTMRFSLSFISAMFFFSFSLLIIRLFNSVMFCFVHFRAMRSQYINCNYIKTYYALKFVIFVCLRPCFLSLDLVDSFVIFILILWQLSMPLFFFFSFSTELKEASTF